MEIGSPAWPLEDARDDLQRFIGTVIRHRQKGADLVWEAYNVDIGGRTRVGRGGPRALVGFHPWLASRSAS